MDTKELFKFVRASKFIVEFTNIPYTAMFKHKLSGTDGNGKPVDFTSEEKEQIKAGVKKFLKKVCK